MTAFMLKPSKAQLKTSRDHQSNAFFIGVSPMGCDGSEWAKGPIVWAQGKHGVLL
jgi:hypothetical protein